LQQAVARASLKWPAASGFAGCPIFGATLFARRAVRVGSFVLPQALPP